MANGLRTWLDRNKVFFEVIAFSVFSLTAIFVAFRANQIAETQTHIMRKTAVPKVDVVMTSDIDNVTNVYNTVWYVFNNGGKLSNLNIKTYSMIHLNLYNSNSRDSIGYPLYNYLNFRTQITGESDGHISTIDNGNSAVKEQRLRTELMNYAYFNVECYAKIAYRDIFDEHHVVYLKLGIDNEELTGAQWTQIEEYWNDAKIRLTLDKLNKDTIQKILKE